MANPKRYQYQSRYGDKPWVSLQRGKNPNRIVHGSTQQKSLRVIAPPPDDDRYLENEWYLGAFGQWRTTAAIGMDWLRFGQHCLQGALYGLIMSGPGTHYAIAGGVLCWLAVVYQRDESRDINDKGWVDVRGIGAGATVGYCAGQVIGVIPWLLERV